MANIYKEFLQEAKWAVDQEQGKDSALEQEENEITTRLNEIKKERSNLAKVNVRFQSYPPAGLEYPCPVCFCLHGALSKMKPIGSENSKDIFHCSKCDIKIAVEINGSDSEIGQEYE